jgi:protein-L-isoaspartate(D-aspartate) O-methyltransferase
MTVVDASAGAGLSSSARRAMIDSQLRTSGVNEPWVLAAMASVPREDFVPEEARAAAYIDRAVPLGGGRFLAAPLVQGRMLAEAKPTLEDKVLLVGDAESYLAALLRPLCRSLDCLAPANAAAPNAKGAKKGAYTLIVVDGAAEELPEGLCARLADDGRLVTGLVQRGVTRLAVGRKAAGEIALLPLAEIGIPVLPELAAPKRWSF